MQRVQLEFSSRTSQEKEVSQSYGRKRSPMKMVFISIDGGSRDVIQRQDFSEHFKGTDQTVLVSILTHEKRALPSSARFLLCCLNETITTSRRATRMIHQSLNYPNDQSHPNQNFQPKVCYFSITSQQGQPLGVPQFEHSYFLPIPFLQLSSVDLSINRRIPVPGNQMETFPIDIVSVISSTATRTIQFCVLHYVLPKRLNVFFVGACLDCFGRAQVAARNISEGQPAMILAQVLFALAHAFSRIGTQIQFLFGWQKMGQPLLFTGTQSSTNISSMTPLTLRVTLQIPFLIPSWSPKMEMILSSFSASADTADRKQQSPSEP